MADEGEVDVLGDFDFKLEVESEIYDTNELPSKSANLLPEYTNPPWMLEQGWNLEMDEKSKATIEKMLLEEQQYLSRKTTKPRRTVQNKLINSPEKTENSLISPSRRVWSEQEKQMLLKGMEIYGRSWTKIAELIPSRTSIQIKSFANQHFKAKEKIDSTPREVGADKLNGSLQDTLSAVSTAKPTIPVGNIVIPSKGRIPKAPTVSNIKGKAVNSLAKNKRKKITHKATKSGRIKTDLSQGQENSDSSLPIIRVRTDTKNHKVTIAPHLMGNINGFCSVSKVGTESDDLSTDEIDIDIENDDDNEDINPVLQSRSISPSSVYEKLVSEANLENTDNQDKIEGVEESCPIGSESSCDKDAENDVKLSKACLRENGKVEIDTSCKASVPDIAYVSCSEVDGCDRRNVESQIKEEEYANQNNAEVYMEKAIAAKKESPKKIYVNSITTVEGQVIHFPVPTSEKVLSPDEITQDERLVHPDFFGNKSSKTPERYLRIRNYILDSWKKCRPYFLNKTSVRPGLKNCGDVNCIGRIHAYLECIGAINFGCEQASYNVPKNVNESTRKEKAVREQMEVSATKLESMRPRKRKVRDEFGYWIDEKDLEGKTIPHKEDNGPKMPKPKQTKLLYDPFKLVPCQLFSEDNPAPFHVEVNKSALIVMDIHAHICKTEVIGMLGGRFCCDQGKLTVSMATPCNSISTGMQCEMDPVSQTQASEEIRSAGLKVIGWYHSHPVFDPNPSVRDMETQLKFQEWFAKGGSNFVGIIVSPYNPRNPSLGSEVNCLTVREQKDELNCDTLVPYKFEFTVHDSNDTSDMTNLALTAQDLATSYSTYRHRVDLTSLYRRSVGVTCLDKLIESVRLQFGDPDPHLEELIDCIRKAFMSTDDISNHSDKMTTEMVTLTTDGIGEIFTVQGDSG